jgi:hypothetical protein
MLIQSVFGVACLLLGIAVNEMVRRSNRIEFYSGEIFKKRFTVYEELWKLIQDAKPVADAVIEDRSLSADKCHRIVSELVLGIANFCDKNSLYLKDDVIVHCCTTYMSVEDIAALPKGKERDSEIASFAESYRKAREIIRAETGLERLDSLFSKVTKAKYSSETIQYYRKVKDQRPS